MKNKSKKLHIYIPLFIFACIVAFVLFKIFSPTEDQKSAKK